MTNCINKEMLVLFLDQELTANQMISIRDHIGRCSDCRQRLDDLQAIDTAISNLPEMDLSADFDTDFWQALKAAQDTHTEKPQKRLSWKTYTAAGLAAMLLMLGGVSLFSRMTPQNREITLIEDIDMLQDYELAANIELLENWDILMQMDDNS